MNILCKLPRQTIPQCAENAVHGFLAVIFVTALMLCYVDDAVTAMQHGSAMSL